MSYKVIDKTHFDLTQENEKKLSYEMLFISEEQRQDEHIKQAIEQNNVRWNQKLAEEREQALKEGYETGFQNGVQQARQDINQHFGTLMESFDELSDRLDHFIAALEPDLTQLAFDLGEKIVGVRNESEELKTLVVSEIKSILRGLSEQTKVSISVSDIDFDSIKALVDERPENENLHVKVADSLQSGEYEIDTPFEAVEKSFKKRLEDFRQQAHLKPTENPE